MTAIFAYSKMYVHAMQITEINLQEVCDWVDNTHEFSAMHKDGEIILTNYREKSILKPNDYLVQLLVEGKKLYMSVSEERWKAEYTEVDTTKFE
ncbi:MAG: hypothetical protein HRU28_02460 [Rhizobiales bacterium]|nr:hypothetical protein [Hyphomicrobiales bacterium]